MFRLAGHLGKTVRWLEENLSSSELTEWLALSRIEPIGERVGHELQAQANYFTALVHRDPKRPAPRFAEFLPEGAPPVSEEQRVQFEVECFRAFALAHNAKFKEEDHGG